MIVDVHAHWLPEEIVHSAHFFSKAWSDIEAQVRMMEETGIARAVLTYPSSDAHLKLGSFSRVSHVFNNNVAKIIKRYPEQFIGAAVLPIDNSHDMVQELKRATEELGFRAISLATSYNGVYIDDSRFLPVYEAAQEKNIPVFVHSQIINPIGFERVNDPLLTPVIEYVFDTTICIGKLLMSEVLQNYPRVKFVFGYFGGVIAHLEHRFDATYVMLRQINFVKDLKAKPSDLLRNIYVDTSGDIKKTNFLSALELFGPGHILWGSDWPAKKDVAGALDAVRGLDITDDDKKNILGGNAEQLFSQ